MPVPTTSHLPEQVTFPTSPPEAWPAPPPPPAPAGPPEPRGNKKAAATLAVIAAVMSVLLAFAFGAFLANQDEAQRTAGSPESPNVAPAPTTTPNTLEAALPDLVAFVERTRGHTFKTEPVVTTLEEQAFDNKLLEQVEQGLAELEDAAVAWKALGYLDPDTDLADAYSSAAETGVLGFFDPVTEELYVKGTSITPLRRAIIVHELTHALDHQHFDLGRLAAVADEDAARAFQSTVEGNARWVEYQYRDTFTEQERQDALQELLGLGGTVNPTQENLPFALAVWMQAPYEVGYHFIEEVRGAKGVAGVDVAFDRPPTTTEQVDHPERFRSREKASKVDAGTVPAGGSEVARGSFGAFDVRMLALAADPAGGMGLLDPSQIDPQALDELELSSVLPEVADWQGGAYVSWRDAQGRSCIRVVVDTDGGGSADSFTLLNDWAQTRSPAATVTANAYDATIASSEHCAG